MANATCGVSDCGQQSFGRQPYCKKHYSRWKRTGQTDRVLVVRTACEIDGCGKPHLSRGMCPMHYRRWRVNGDPRVVLKVRGERTCYAPDCEAPADSLGLCGKHYRRVRTYGSTELPVAEAASCRVDGCDVGAVARGLCNKHYRRLMVHGPDGLRQGDTRTCQRRGCPSRHYAHDLCRKHWSETYRANNRELMAQRSALRRERSASGMSRDEIAEALAFRQLIALDPCTYCGGPSGTVDHIDAIHVGGTDRWTNLAAACLSCNSSKKTKTPLEFMLWRLAREGASRGHSAGSPPGPT